MNFFERLFHRRIKYAHIESKLRISDYKLPWSLWTYYYFINPFYGFETKFEHDVDRFLCCKLDRFNVDYINNQLIAVYNEAMADIDEQYIYKKKESFAIKTNRKVYISAMQKRKELLEHQNKIFEQQLKEDNISI